MTWHRTGASSRPDTQWELSDEERESRWTLIRMKGGKQDPPARYSTRGSEMREWAEDMARVSSDADWRAAATGLVLADFECRHEKMEHDEIQVCACFEPMQVDEVLRLVVERIVAQVSAKSQGSADLDQGVAEIGQGSA